MAMRFVSSAWKSALYEAHYSDDRFYIDFRRDDYLPVSGTPTYTLVTSGDNQPGSHYLSGGTPLYLNELQDSLSFEIRFKPKFVYSVATDQVLLQWYESATQYFKVYYNATADKFYVEWQDGGTARSLESQQFDDGTTYEDIDQWITLSFTADLTTGDTTGAQLWINRTSQDATWSGAIDTPTISKVELRFNEADNYNIAYARLFPSETVVDADVQNAFEDMYAEELYFNFDGNAVGRHRCNITRHVKSYGYSASAENDAGSQTANRLSMTLYNLAGQFADDQYAAFDPENDIFNGLVTQKYLRQRCGVFMESWYSNDFEPLFIGYLDDSGFPRNTRADEYSEVSIKAEDYIGQIARKFKDRPVYYENKNLCDTADETNSLLHLVSRLATRRTFYNYCRNSNFEDLDGFGEPNLWRDFDVTLTRDSTYTFCDSTYSGKIVFSADGWVYQTAHFYDTNKEYSVFGKEPYFYPDADTTWTASVWVRSDAAFTGTLRLAHAAARGSGGTTAAISLTGDEGWTQYIVSNTFDTDSEYILLGIEADSGTLYINGPTIRFGSTMYNGYVVNTNSPDPGDYIDTDGIAYEDIDYVGIDGEDMDVLHPWVLIKEQSSLWEEVKSIGDASVARYLGMDKAGTLRFRSSISGTDPSTLETVDAPMSLATTLESEKANRIIVHGVKIEKSSYPQILWIWTASRANDSDSDEGDILAVSIGGISPTYYPATGSGEELWAKYGDI